MKSGSKSPSPKQSAKKAKAEKLTTKAKAAKPAKPGKPSFLDRIASFVVPANASGLARVPAKLAANEQAAALLGLGYPHLLVTVDEPVVELPDYEAYKRHYRGAVVVPRGLPPIMHAVARAGSAAEALDEAVVSPPKATLGEAALDALRFGGRDIVTIVEALFGAAPTAAAFVDALVAASVQDLNGGKYENYGYAIAYSLGWMLWRLPADVRAKHRTQLAGVLDRLRGAGELWRTGQALDVILGGRAGVERSGRGFNGELFLGELAWADDDPEWVASMVTTKLHDLRPADREMFDIQLAVVGGPKVLAALRGATDRFQKDQRKSIEAQLALCVP